MNRLFHLIRHALTRAHRRAAWSWCGACMAVVLAGCGPGVGGTGTGSPQGMLEPFGATAVELCTGGALPEALGCPQGGSQQSPLPASGPRYFADRSPAPRVTLLADGNRATLEAACERLHFVGVWGVVGAGAPRLYGELQRDGAPPEPATLSLALAGSDVQWVLRDAQGQVLLGPQALRPVAGMPPVPVCSP